MFLQSSFKFVFWKLLRKHNILNYVYYFKFLQYSEFPFLQMGSLGIRSVIAFSPTVECGTEEYWLWNIFYIFILVLLIAVIIFIFIAAKKAAKKAILSPKVGISRYSSKSNVILHKEEFSQLEKFGNIWRQPFRDHVPWWTSVELLVRLVLVAIFSFTITRVPSLTNLLIGIAICL